MKNEKWKVKMRMFFVILYMDNFVKLRMRETVPSFIFI